MMFRSAASVVLMVLGFISPLRAESDRTLDESRGVVSRAMNLSARTAQELALARDFRATRRARCLDSTLTQINASLRTIQSTAERLTVATRAGRTAEIPHLLTVLRTLDAHAPALARAVAACMDEDVPAGATTVEVVTAARVSTGPLSTQRHAELDASLLRTAGRFR